MYYINREVRVTLHECLRGKSFPVKLDIHWRYQVVW